MIILEGCGSIRTRLAGTYAARIWVEAPAVTRRERLRARPDWPAYEPHAEQWAAAEDRLYRAEQTRQRCDFIIAEPGRRRRGHGPAAGLGWTVKPRVPSTLTAPLRPPSKSPGARRWPVATA